MFRRLRIALLLFVLATVAIGAWRDKAKATSWKSTLQVAVFPINGDGSAAVQRYIEALNEESFGPIADYLDEQGRRYGLNLVQPVRVSLGQVIPAMPPALSGNGALSALRWSLSMRYWAWRHTPDVAINPDVRLYLLYFDPARYDSVPHSVGLEKGRIGLANLFATRAMHGSNLVVTTHELLHTLGASDKYDPGTDLPRHPEGYAEPDRLPLLPQRWAEIMAGRIPLSETRAEIPDSLQVTLIGAATAGEIGWRQR